MNQQSCPSCGGSLPENAPAGICPRCLMLAGLEEHNDPTLTPASGQTFIPPAPHELTDCFSQLEVIELLGQGGMGAVYKGRQTKLDRLVAIKVIRPESAHDPAFAERFNREARTLAKLNHDNIVSIHDFGEVTVRQTTGAPQLLYYFVMEYVDGSDLRQVMQSGLAPNHAMAVISQMCDALQYAHDAGIVHRDIKPENILLDARGKVKIADFGLAKLSSRSERDLTLTGTHQVMGTPRYMAPEQMEGSRAVDHRADVFSLGVVFYEMLTGEIPMGQFEPPSKKTSVDERLDSIVLRAMAREPDRRYQRASEIRENLADVSSAGIPAYADGGLPGPSTILDYGVNRVMAGVRDGVKASSESNFSATLSGLLIFVLSALGMYGYFRIGTNDGQIPLHDPNPALFNLGFLTCLAVYLLAGGVSHMTRFRAVFVFAMGVATFGISIFLRGDMPKTPQADLPNILSLACVGIMLIGAWELQRTRRLKSNQKQKSARRKKPESAHVSFLVPAGTQVGSYVESHFSMLGYQLLEQTPGKWIFERGSRFGHMGVDLRKCLTTLTVQTGSHPEGMWLSCGWAVEAYVSGGEIRKLEREAQELARLLGVESVTLTNANNTKNAAAPGASETVACVLGATTKAGNWIPPRRINAFCMWGGMELDFREARMEPGLHEIHVVTIMGGCEITVPENIPVEVNGVGILGGFDQTGSGAHDASSGTPKTVLRVSGVALMGGVTVGVKGPKKSKKILPW